MPHITVVISNHFQLKVGKKKMQEWLDGKGIQYPVRAIKADIYSIIQVKPKSRK
jgi:hypothetical protein